MIPPPPPNTDADGEIDVETYSEAGFVWDAAANKWTCLPGAPQGRKGLPVVGASVYTEHESAEILTLSYRLPRGWRTTPQHLWPTLPRGPKVRWRPGEPNPQDLFDYLAAGGTLESHNSMFERLAWGNICTRKYAWPSVEPRARQLRCSMAKARVNSLPGALGPLSDVLRLPVPKDKDGKRLLDKFSVPRNPTKTDPRLRILPEDDPADFEKLQAYCDTDLDAEHGASRHPRVAPMSGEELDFWLIDQEINFRGVQIDRPAVRDCIAILNQALVKYGDECRAITGGLDPTQVQALGGWLHAHGVHMDSLDAAALEAALDPARAALLPPQCKRVLEIRQLIGSASVKKLFAMENQANAADRLQNLIVHHGARTGRPTGEGPQPLNLPREGPSLYWCAACKAPFGVHHSRCPWCGVSAATGKPPRKWSAEAVDYVVDIISHRSLELLEWYFGDALSCISGCLRGLFVAKPGHDLIASDFSSIEAVVTAMLAGCEWRIRAFRENKPIYLLSAAKITGKSLDFYLNHKAQTGQDHPDRDKGKRGELSNGFGGWLGASRRFGAEGSDEELKRDILAWRDASPEIPEMWGGQWQGTPWNGKPEMYGFEGCAVQAIQFPGRVFSYAGIRFQVRTFADGNTALIVTLLSGRDLTYHNPRLSPSTRPTARPGELSIFYMTWNSNPQYGAMGWIVMDTYGGKLTENIVQAVAHDILRFAIMNLRAAGYPTVLHIYDEVVCEIPIGTGSIEDFERIMMIMPPWAADWPIRAAGGWRGRRYRKS